MRIIHRLEVSSTNDEVIRLAQSGEALPFWCIADVQNNGRGRRGRQWQSINGNMFATGLYEIGKDAASAATLSFVVSYSLFEALQNFIDADKIKLKWPNDVLVDSKKISGILLESSFQNKILQLSIGIGVNVVSAPEIDSYETTSIADNLKFNCNVPKAIDLLEIFLEYFEINYNDWLVNGINNIIPKWLSHAHRLNQNIEINQGNNKYNGKFINIDNNGELILQIDDNNIIKINSGEVLL